MYERVKDWLGRWDERLFWGAFGVTLAVYLLPLALSRFLPFSDLPGHLGVVGALAHADVAEARIHAHYSLNPHFAPNCLEYYVTWGLSAIFGVTGAARLFAALCVAALPLAFLYALRVFRRNRWLVFLAFPFAYPRIMWFGFMGSALAVALVFLAVALAYRATQRRHLAYPALLAATLALTGASHPFFFAIALGLTAGTLTLGTIWGPRRGQNWVAWSAFLPAILLFYGWFSRLFAGGPKRPGQGSLLDHLLDRRPDLDVYWRWLKEWSLGAYRGGLEATILWILLLVAAGLVGWSALHAARRTWASWRPGTTTARAWAWQDARPGILLGVFASLLTAYLLLPGVVHRPVYWWAVAQRLVTPLLLAAILLFCARPRPKAPAGLLVLPALLAAIYYGGFLAYDFKHHFNDTEMRGLPRALAAIPRGKRVLGLVEFRETHYAHFPLGFAASYYVALRGGFATPFPTVPGYRKIAWVYPRHRPPEPAWGQLARFHYRRHGPYYHYFLIKRHRDGKTRWRRFPKRCVTVIGHYGLWTVVERHPLVPGC